MVMTPRFVWTCQIEHGLGKECVGLLWISSNRCYMYMHIYTLSSSIALRVVSPSCDDSKIPRYPTMSLFLTSHYLRTWQWP